MAEKTSTLGCINKEHNLIFILDKKNRISFPCLKPYTLVEALKETDVFEEKRLGEKTFYFVREEPDKTIDYPHHFPCWAVTEMTVEVSHIRQNKNPGPDPNSDIKEQLEQEKTIFFYISAKGEKGNCKTKNFLQKTSKNATFLCTYAYQGETVIDALRRDGRFVPSMLEKFDGLSNKKSDSLVKMSGTITIKSFHEQYFSIRMKQDTKAPNLQVKKEEKYNLPCSSHDTYTAKTKPDAKKKGEPKQCDDQSKSSSAISSETEPSQDTDGRQRKPRKMYKIEDSAEILKILRSQFDGLVKEMKKQHAGKRFSMSKLLKEEFGKNTQSFSEISRLKTLMKRSNSVCLIDSGKLKGSGFLLFCNFILTNAHVVKDCQEENISVTFGFEDHKEPKICRAKKVFGHYGKDQWGRYQDYAFLELEEHPDPLCEPLLSVYQKFPKSRGLSIIGHPDGGVKKMDLTSIIEIEKRSEEMGNKIGMNPGFILQYSECEDWKTFKEMENDENIVTYHTCFFYGSSGSPVFNEDCQLVAMHTGGYIQGERKNQMVIEYAIPMHVTLEHFVLQMVVQKQCDVLAKFTFKALQHDSPKCFVNDFLTYLCKSLKRKPDDAMHMLENACDYSDVKKFFSNLLLDEQIEPMECEPSAP